MDWEKHIEMQPSLQLGDVDNIELDIHVEETVMTDEQREILRKQIAVYAFICEKLVEMHKSAIGEEDPIGEKVGDVNSNPSFVHNIPYRQRWSPTPLHIQNLERVFNEDTETPTKEKIKEIALELSQYGQISATNVYNWFQNRRARSRRKQLNSASTNVGSEVETEIEQDTKPQEINQTILSIDVLVDPFESIFASEGTVHPSPSLDEFDFFQNTLEQSSLDDSTRKMEGEDNYNHYEAGDNNNK